MRGSSDAACLWLPASVLLQVSSVTDAAQENEHFPRRAMLGRDIGASSTQAC